MESHITLLKENQVAAANRAYAEGREAGLEEVITRLESLAKTLRDDAESFRFRGLIAVCNAKSDAAYGHDRAADEIRALNTAKPGEESR